MTAAKIGAVEKLAMRCVVVVLTVTAIAASATSCRRDQPEPSVGEASLTAASIVAVPTESAVSELAQAQCTNDVRCGRGTGGEHGNLAECVRHRRRDLGLELDPATSCAGGVDRVRLHQCLAAVRAEECGIGGADHVTSAVACRGSELCPRLMSPERGGTE